MWNGTSKKLPKRDILLKRKYRIMIVDDNQRNVELLREQFKQSGYETISCSSGSEVLNAVSREKPDLVLLDIMMPNLDGYQTCGILKEQYRDKFLPVILISVKDDAESKIRGLSSGADDYMVKPYDFHELKMRILNLLKIVELDEEQVLLFEYYQQNLQLFKEIRLLMEGLSYALEKIGEGKETDTQFAEKQISVILEKIDHLERSRG